MIDPTAALTIAVLIPLAVLGAAIVAGAAAMAVLGARWRLPLDDAPSSSRRDRTRCSPIDTGPL